MDDFNLWQQLILGATKPFRTGANILAQNWGSALTGKDMSQEENQGKFLQWLAGGLTPEEQETINDKPYLSALKSGAGMASTLAPFGTQGLRAAQFAANPLTNRIAQLTSQGALEGSLGGFGLSREGKEVQDTLTGGLVGAGGELLMDYLTNPTFRSMITDATTTVDPRTGMRMYRGSVGQDVDINDLRQKALNSANIPDQPTQMTNMTQSRILDDIQDDIERISNAPHTREGLEYLQEIQRLYGDELGGTIDMPLRLYDLSDNTINLGKPYPTDTTPNTDNYARLVDSNSDSSALELINTDAPDMGIPDNELKIIDSADFDNSMTSGGKIDMLKDNPMAQLEIEAKNYATPEEFVSEQFSKKPEYGMSHRPTYEGMPPAHNLLEGETLPRDVYTKPEWSIASGRNFKTDKAAQESWSALQKIKGKPDVEVTIYRATRKNELNPGDWVTFSKNYAEDSVEGTAEKVYPFRVKAKDIIFAGDDINEFGYYPKSIFEEIWKRAHSLSGADSLKKSLHDTYTKIIDNSGNLK